MQTTKNKTRELEMLQRSIGLQSALDEGKFVAFEVFVLAVGIVMISV